MADNNLDMLRGAMSDIFSGSPSGVSGSSYRQVDFTDLRNTIMQLTGDLVNYSVPYEGPVRPKGNGVGPGKDRIRRYDDRHATERTKEFISKIYPIMEEELGRYKHSGDTINWVMQQLALESNYGQSDIGGSYNLAGIQAVQGNAGPGRGEVYVTRDKKVYKDINDIPNGKEFRRFRTYDGYRDFVKNYLSLINNRYNALTAGSHEQFIDRLHGRSASRAGVKDPDMQTKYDYSESYDIYRDSIGKYKTLVRLMNDFKTNGNSFAQGGELGSDNDYTLGLSLKDASDVNDMVVEDDFIEPEPAPANVDIDVAIANISDSVGDIGEGEEEVNQVEASNAAGAYTIASGLINVLRNRARTREAMREKRQHDEWTGDVIKFGEQKNSVGKINDAFIEPEWPLVEITDAGDLKYAAELAHDTYEGIKGGNVSGSLLGAGIGAAMLALPGSIKAIDNLGGGYMLKSLMRGNPLEKQISKNGTVNVNNIRAVMCKAGKVDQAVVDKVLASEEFSGKKAIDYNRFRKAVQDELITYDRTPNTKWSDYGLDRIGLSFRNKTDVRNAEDRMNMLRERIATGRFSNGEKLTESDITDAKSELKKYDAFPKQYQKLHKGADIRTVTDKMGNTWYEVDVPNDYLNMEWPYKYGGTLNNKFATGGHLYWPGGPKSKKKSFIQKVAEKYHDISGRLPDNVNIAAYRAAKEAAADGTGILGMLNGFIPNLNEVKKSEPGKEPYTDEAFLLSPERQQAFLESLGYTLDTSGDYGLVESAVNKYMEATGRHVPVYKYGSDDISRNNLIPLNHPILQSHTTFANMDVSLDKFEQKDSIGDRTDFPLRFYRDMDGNLYVKEWDFLDHGNYSHGPLGDDADVYRTQGLTDSIKRYGDLMDIAGNPFVRTTGYQKVTDYALPYAYHILDESIPADLTPGYDYNSIKNRILGGEFDIKAHGGKIHIKPQNRGKFTALKKRTGHSASWFKENGTPAQKKMAIFDLNSRKWRHDDGGYLNY